MKPKQTLTSAQKRFGLVLASKVKFARYFYQSDLSEPMSTRQKLFFNDLSQYKILATGRKTAKTISNEVDVIHHGITYRGGGVREVMFVTPGEAQMEPFIERLISKINRVPLFTILNGGYNQNKGLLKWETGENLYFRIEGSSGRDDNMVGLRAAAIWGDEMQLGNWACYNSRLQTALPGCTVKYTGVPNGVRNTPFWSLDQTEAGSDYSKTKLSTFVNPLYWQPGEREKLKKSYKKGSQDWLTLVLGLWGAELFSSFPPGSFILGTQPYRVVRLYARQLPEDLGPEAVTWLAAQLLVPHLDVAEYAIGMDHGFLQDPTEIGISYRQKTWVEGVDAEGVPGEVPDTNWRLILRLHVEGANHKQQARLLQLLVWVLGQAKVRRFALDILNKGIDISTELHESKQGEWWSTHFLPYNSNGITLVDPLGRARERLEEEGKIPVDWVKLRNKQFYTQRLQAALIASAVGLNEQTKLWLGPDAELEDQLTDTREKKTPTGIIYVPKNDASHRPEDHCVDMLRALIAAQLAAQAAKDDEDEDGGPEGGNSIWLEHGPYAAGKWRAPWARRSEISRPGF